MHNVFFDDVRDAPDDTWEVCRDIEKLKDMLICGYIDNLSLDHDIGCFNCNGREITGYDVLCWIEQSGHVPHGKILIHSANPVGRMRMLQVIKKLGKL